MIKKEMKEDSCSLHQALLKPEIFRNLVWTAADIADFRRAVLPLAQAAAKSGRRVIYIHYSGCEVLFEEKSFPEGGFSMQEVPLSHRFEVFTVAVYSLIAEGGEDAVYLFDPLSMLQAAWTTDLMMENFITVMTCLVKKKGVSAHYPRLPVQIGNLRSMDRPFILVNDFYHNGYRMQKITQSLRGQGLREEGLIAGAVSGRGREMARREGLSVEAVYEIPNMKLWILESDMIPFYGGDRVEQMREDPDREDGFVAGRRPSIYPMLPYQMPSFLKDAPYQAVYDLSVICLENARRLFTVLEKIYENRFFRRLTLERLTEVIDDPGFPEAALESPLSQGQTASGLLEQEITRLKRFKV